MRPPLRSHVGRSAAARLVGLLLALAACAPSSERVAADREGARPSLRVRVVEGRLAAPDSLPAGWTRFSYEVPGRDAGGHNAVAFALPDGTTPEAFVAMLDSAVGTPAGATALGGPESAATELALRLDPGRVIVACMLRDAARRRHASRGEWHAVHVHAPAIAADSGVAPVPTHRVELRDFAFVGPAEWPVGRQVIEVRNAGAADHLLLLTRLRDGHTLRDWVSATGADSVAEAVAGAARLGAGRSVYLKVALRPGTYVLSCLIRDPRTRQLHVEMGMLREVRVTASPRTTAAPPQPTRARSVPRVSRAPHSAASAGSAIAAA